MPEEPGKEIHVVKQGYLSTMAAQGRAVLLVPPAVRPRTVGTDTVIPPSARCCLFLVFLSALRGQTAGELLVYVELGQTRLIHTKH